MSAPADRRLIHLVLLAAVLCAALAATNAVAQKMREVLGPGDTVRITVLRHPDLTTEGRITEDGRLNVPLVGLVSLQGKTPDAAAREIAGLLKSGGYLVNPQIDVAVLEARSRQVSVLGFVTRPGRYMLDGTSAKVTDVLAMAGGLVPAASDTAIVTRARDGKSESVSVDLAAIIQKGDLGKDIEVGSGDSVFVPKAPVVYVYGEVARGGSYRIEPDMTVMQAISLAGGITPRGSENRIKLRRKEGDGKWTETSASPRDRVAADDVIYVREGLF
ncbi:MAG TPA: polysaccharide export protein EpsE [Burkholderiales bacterium]|nr:polysaccharide export protein EpsE [Burkholderiales bacterium]